MRTITPDGLVDLILKSGLLNLEQLAGYPLPDAAAEPAMAAREFAARLVKDRMLTGFQAKHLLAGRHRGFYFGGKYKVLAHLGSGGMGHVYLCEHVLLQRLVAVKRLALGAAGTGAKEAAERFLREARAAAAIDHPNVVHVYDKDRDGNDPYLVMEYVDGTSLHDLVSSHGPFPSDRAADCGRQACAGLHAAAELGLIHRDMKPGNLMLDRTGVVKVLDLGLARFVLDTSRNANLTARFDAAVVGTADYIAPEQASDSALADHRSDQYALGGTLYYLLTGRPPFPDGTVSQKMLWHQNKMPVPVQDRRPEVPAGLAAVVERMLAKDPADRYPTHAEAGEALAVWAAVPEKPPTMLMPRIPTTDYRLGLCHGPPPSDAPGSGAALTPSPGRAEMETTEDEPRPAVPTPRRSGTVKGKLTAPGITPRTRLQQPEPEPLPVPPVIEPRRRWPAYVAGGVLLVAAAGVGYSLRPPGQPASTGPVASAPPPAAVPLVSELKAGGGTAIEPLMEYWSAEYAKKTGVKVTYTSSGFAPATLDRGLAFGCTNLPLTDAELAEATAAGGPVLHIPLALGGVVPAYNLPDVNAPLRFTGPLLADIFLGKVTAWNDPAIRTNNPGVGLPARKIQVVYRSDPNGSTHIWNDFLSRTSGAWKEKVGVRTGFAEPLPGTGVKGSNGVTTAVSQTVGAIGYVERSHAMTHRLSVGRVLNRSGRYVEPTPEAVTAAAAARLETLPIDLRYSLVDAGGDGSYPLADSIWAVLYARPAVGHPPGLIDFLWWATHDGQAVLTELQYAPLPPELVALIETKLRPLRK